MKQSILIFCLIFVEVIGFSQIACLPISDGIPAGDEPPGCFLCQDSYVGSTNGFTPDSVSYDFPCGEIENSQWFTAVAAKNGKLEILISSENCQNDDGLEVAVYDLQLSLVSDCEATVLSNESISLSVSDLIPHQNYNIMIDGVDGDICDFEMVVENRSRLEVATPNNRIKVSPEIQPCKGGTFCYSIFSVEGAKGYSWSIPSTARVISGGKVEDLEVCVTYERNGIGVLKVTPFSRCEIAYPKLLDVNITAMNTVIQEQVCPMEYLNHKFRDTCLTAASGCDSCLIYDLRIVEDKTFLIDTNICSTNCVQVGDSCFAETGVHRVVFEDVFEKGCDSIVNLVLRSLSVFPSPIINCTHSNEDVLVEWSAVSGAKTYDVFINRDSFTTVNTNYFLIKDIPSDSIVNVKIQPLGECTYLPAEISCGTSVTNTNNDFLDRKIAVFPNPTTGEVNIETDLEIEGIEIYDIAGHLLQKEKTTSFNLKNRESGIYFLKIKTSEGVTVKRVLLSLF